MKKKFFIRPRLIIPVTLTFAAILIIVTALDIYLSYRDIYLSKSEEAISLLRSVQKSGENAYLSSIEVENLIEDKLVNSAYLISLLENNKELTSEDLNNISRANNIDHIYLFSSPDKPDLINTNTPYSELDIYENYREEADSVISGSFDYFIAGSTNDSDGNSHLLILHKRPASRRGFMALSVESKYFLEFRKNIGVGRLFQKIAESKDIKYIVIQDSSGIITASKGINDLSSIEGDKFLSNSMAERRITTREVTFDNETIFEAVKPFRTGDEISGIIRIGLSLKPLRSLINWTILRSLSVSLLLLLIGTIVIIYIAGSQSYDILKNEYYKMQGYTEKVLDNMSDAVIVTDSNGKINLFNKAAEIIFHITSDEITGKDFSDLVLWTNSPIEQTLKTGLPVEYFEKIVWTKNARQVIVGGSSSIIQNNMGNTEAVVVVVRDITAIRSFEEAKKRHEKLSAMGELAAGVAHEIKNPLNIIGINAQRLEMEFVPVEDKDEYKGLIKDMMNEVFRVKNIIDQFLRFARPQKIIKQKVNMREFIDDISVSYKSRGLKDGVKFNCSSDDFVAMVDPAQMRQVINNLLENAFDAVDRNGAVCLEASGNETTLVIKVSDNGTGISKENLNKIFDIYYTTKSTGTGLGLSIVNQIITGHGGTIKVNSNPGQGSVFTIEVPIP